MLLGWGESTKYPFNKLIKGCFLKILILFIIIYYIYIIWSVSKFIIKNIYLKYN